MIDTSAREKVFEHLFGDRVAVAADSLQTGPVQNRNLTAMATDQS